MIAVICALVCVAGADPDDTTKTTPPTVIDTAEAVPVPAGTTATVAPMIVDSTFCRADPFRRYTVKTAVYDFSFVDLLLRSGIVPWHDATIWIEPRPVDLVIGAIPIVPVRECWFSAAMFPATFFTELAGTIDGDPRAAGTILRAIPDCQIYDRPFSAITFTGLGHTTLYDLAFARPLDRASMLHLHGAYSRSGLAQTQRTTALIAAFQDHHLVPVRAEFAYGEHEDGPERQYTTIGGDCAACLAAHRATFSGSRSTYRYHRYETGETQAYTADDYALFTESRIQSGRVNVDAGLAAGATEEVYRNEEPDISETAAQSYRGTPWIASTRHDGSAALRISDQIRVIADGSTLHAPQGTVLVRTRGRGTWYAGGRSHVSLADRPGEVWIGFTAASLGAELYRAESTTLVEHHLRVAPLSFLTLENDGYYAFETTDGLPNAAGLLRLTATCTVGRTALSAAGTARYLVLPGPNEPAGADLRSALGAAATVRFLTLTFGAYADNILDASLWPYYTRDMTYGVVLKWEFWD